MATVTRHDPVPVAAPPPTYTLELSDRELLLLQAVIYAVWQKNACPEREQLSKSFLAPMFDASDRFSPQAKREVEVEGFVL